MRIIAIPNDPGAVSYNDFKRYKDHLFHVIKKIAYAKNIKIYGYDEEIDDNPEFLNNVKKAIENGANVKIIYAKKDLNDNIIELSKKYPGNIEIKSIPERRYEKNIINKILMRAFPSLCMCDYKVIDDLVTNANPLYKTSKFKAKLNFLEIIYREEFWGLSYDHKKFLGIILDRFDRDWQKAQKVNLN